MALRRMVDRRLAFRARTIAPGVLRDQLLHVVAGGGKRVRAVLVLASCEAVGGDARSSVDAAAAIELLHNFTLVHDDIMDNAATRRGRPTVHARWGVSHGILAGDTLMALASQSLLSNASGNKDFLFHVFVGGLRDVCIGQSEDLLLAGRRSAGVEEYMAMIEKKTAALISAAAMMGGISGGGTAGEVRSLGSFGFHLGRAFQVQDDLLDVVADEKAFGKKIGGDIEEGKKTFLLVEALARARGTDRKILSAVASGKRGRRTWSVREVAGIYRRLGVLTAAERRVASETRKAVHALSRLRPGRGREMLAWMSDMLLKRVS